MKLETIRSEFLNYFNAQGHQVLPSSALVPHNDPTLMFTNAGMVQFKNIFTGKEAIPTPPRAATAQKCVRAGGKHNDLDNVGYTARHHTFFEMMGNFSFADYFKEEAIYYAWNLLTKKMGISAEKLYATVYHTDDEAFGLWKKIAGLPEGKIMRIPTSDNFWAMGDTGPCGPCSEIFYDHGADAAHGAWALDAQGNDQFGDRFIEIWNLVFMQYEQVDKDTRISLPKPSIDTGMGLERMAAVMQGKHDNYAIDIFEEIMRATESLISVRRTERNAASFKVIADHLRSSCFLLADGVAPSNEGRGYVLRRIMRRAMRHAHMLGAQQPLMYRLVPVLVQVMGGAYSELGRAQAMMTHTLRLEEERFRETLGRGLKLLEEAKEGIANGGVLDGAVAFKLYDTYGFPLDLTQDILRSEAITVDEAGFNAAMQEQKARARAAWKGSGASAVSDIWLSLYDMHGATEFLGYSQQKNAATLQAIVQDGQVVARAEAGQRVQLIFNQTVAYAESGGQAGDKGTLTNDDGVVIGVIEDVTAPVSGLYVHHVTLQKAVAHGDVVAIAYDAELRAATRANHSATHLLHAALREALGEHITQKGSLVTASRLRFDFSHHQGVSAEELQRIEARVNEMIYGNSLVTTALMTPDAAIAAGAMALFGEKYGEEVRVLSMGAPMEGSKSFSIELCGGTHVERTGDIGYFKIISESAIASGVRRIEAVTRADAVQVMQQQESVLKQAAGLLTVSSEEVATRLASLLEERKSLQREVAEAKKQLALANSGEVSREMLGDVQFISRHSEGLEAKELRGIAMELLAGQARTIVALTTNVEGKGAVLVAVSSDIITTHPAPTYVQKAVEVLGGKGGGGRPEMAQGGGADGGKGEAALAAIKGLLAAQ
jgi:alanyl-tRNA synthetase